ncbi:MAG: Gfo/Idh/MocA family oxidoreductase [Nitrospirae bacterium]|nr:Gfo/Idh/MocA family oxidoreductase [Nitrospirota bacterium]
MKILVVGVGSIGSRHLKNLADLGNEVIAVDINADNLKKIEPFAKEVFISLEDALIMDSDAAFICTYSNDHIRPAMKCAEAGCHLFIEKPLSLNMHEVDKLVQVIEKNSLISMVGCNMRFHPAIAAIHETLSTNSLFSRPLWANLESGFYLPFDKKDYRNHYKALKSLGGNLIFDGIHELDYAAWFFGEPVEVICDKGIISSLEIDTEDHVEMIVRFASGSVCTIHMDYLQHGYSRHCKVVCSEGTIAWDFVRGDIGTITTSEPEWAWNDMKIDLCYNGMYLDEVRYFLDCIKSGKETFNSVGHSILVLKLALAAERSAVTKAWEKVV